MSTITKDALELGQLVKNIVDAKRPLTEDDLIGPILCDQHGIVLPFPKEGEIDDRQRLFEKLRDLFEAIDKLADFYKPET